MPLFQDNDFNIAHNDAGSSTAGVVKVDLSAVTETRTITMPDADVTLGSGGMTNPMTAAGDLIVGGTAGAPAVLAADTNDMVLGMASGTPAWCLLTVGFDGGEET
jgi:hypothetical protein